MKRQSTANKLVIVLVVLWVVMPRFVTAADDFGAVVKLVERFYHVKHQGIPLLARASMRVATTVARIRGGEIKRLAEAGSVKLAVFEDQEFDSRGAIAEFKASIVATLGPSWSPLVQTISAKDEQQTHIFLREVDKKFNVLVVSIERRDAAVVQVTLKPDILAELMKDPNDMGRAITEDARTNDPE
jgi:hypothetical protein